MVVPCIFNACLLYGKCGYILGIQNLNIIAVVKYIAIFEPVGVIKIYDKYEH